MAEETDFAKDKQRGRRRSFNFYMVTSQSKHSHLPPRERLRAKAPGQTTAAWGIHMEPSTVQNAPYHHNFATRVFRVLMPSRHSFSARYEANHRKIYYLAETSRLLVFRSEPCFARGNRFC